ncbi:MAG: HDIG domain-containing protein [Spirochaetia bacterium]|nr:HDIG domain-containing protein [Spirochaetia bacterium]
MKPKTEGRARAAATRLAAMALGSTKVSRVDRLILAGAFAASMAVAALLGPGGPLSEGAVVSDFEVGKVAERDVVAIRDLVYVDEAATEIRLDAERRLVPAVFVVDEEASREASLELGRFRSYLAELLAREAGESRALALQRDWPGALGKEAAASLLALADPLTAVDAAAQALAELLARGILEVPDAGLEDYNPDVFEIRRWREGRLAYERVPVDRAPVVRRVPALADEILRARALPAGRREVATVIVASFASANAPFDAEQSSRRMEAALARVEPVVRRVERGEYLVRRGFVVTEADVERLRAARDSSRRFDFGRVFGAALVIAFALAIGARAAASSLSGVNFTRQTLLVTLSLAFFMFVAAQLVRRFVPTGPGLPPAAFLPAAFAAIVVSLLVSARFATSFAVVTTLLASTAFGLDPRTIVTVLVGSLAGVFAARDADNRIDLVRAGAVLALIQAGASIAVDLVSGAEASTLLQAGVWSGLNGFFCAILAIGLLPLLEQALNAPTRFRLMELSDLNAPPLKRLLTVAPGTYAHSVTVAHLAETACREIGANPLIARVGAYYHDIGKIDQPEYFIENQAGGRNKHDDINPRLSVTVIRSHVKLGVERARALGLPREVVDIVAQHHGNALIPWFFDKARKKDAAAVPEDYSYPGQPPASREAAVVMLADAVEAASRTLKKPSIGKLEDLVRGLAMERVRDGQLSRADLTFRDLETIVASFVRILAGHFHSRIEYPKVRENAR